MTQARNRASLATAKVIPIFIVLIVAYASYAITGPLAVEYLLNPPHGVQRRVPVALGVTIAYYILLIPVAATWLRLLLVVWRHPGHVPLGSTKATGEVENAPGLEQIWGKDVFVCDPRGFPIFCQQCKAWKPDRVHHNQDCGRCTLKMDHFCPWVGGVVGERSYKFFLQFNFYSFLLSAFTMSVFAFFVAEKQEDSNLEVQWLIALGLSGFFTLFTIGMVGNGLWMTFRNVTTIENINAYSGTMLLAVALPPELQGQDLKEPPVPPNTYRQHDVSPSRSGDSGRPLNSEIDDPSHSSYFSNLGTRRPPRRSSLLPYQDRIWKGTVTYPLHLPIDRPPLPAPQPKTFAILETLPGMNPWDLGTPFWNFKAVFGQQLHDWLLPIRHSPCCDHSSGISMYPLGPDFEELLVEAGLMARPASLPPRDSVHRASTKAEAAARKRRRKRRLDAGWQNGERPDGWMSEKEARRVRNEKRRSLQGAPPSTLAGRDAVR